jgi:hypothetical protein
MATEEVEAMFFAKYTINLPYIYLYFHPRNPILLYNFCQRWLDSLYS